MRTIRGPIAFASFVVLALLLTLPVYAMPTFTEGMWEMKGDLKFEGGGMKINGKVIPMKSMPIHYSKCLTKKDMVPHEEGKNQSCKKVSEKMSGNSISWVIKCTEKNGVMIESTGSGTYSKTSFEGKMRSVITDAQGEKSTATAVMKGHRTGPCK